MSSTISATIGNTPLLKLSNLAGKDGATVLAKQESRNPMGSVKCRIAVSMIQAAEKGNTVLGFAFVCASKGLKLILTMPESMSLERRQMLKHLGAELVLTPAAEGMKGAIARAKQIVDEELNRLDNAGQQQ